ncbi:MAG: four helix bundle protein [Eubacteriales bacterium]
MAKDLGYISEDDFMKLYKQCNEIGKMLTGLLKSLRKCKSEKYE